MPRIELTITTKYFNELNARHGIREILQNAQDAEDQYNAPMTVDHVGDTLRVENIGTVLTHEVLLLGHTSKQDRQDLRGHFGEGLKIGILALLRNGHEVKIRTGSEVWVPKIENSEKFNSPVLVFHIEKGRLEKARVRVEISGVSKEMWGDIRKDFLFLDKPKESESIRTSAGTLLVNERYRGKLFVKGIFVQSDPGLTYGYDFTSAHTDHNRKIVDSFDRRYYTRTIWSNALAIRPDLFEPFFGLLENEAMDLEGLRDFGAAEIPAPILNRVEKKFSDRHGKNAIPVGNLAESKDIEHLGKVGVVVPKILGAVLRQTMGNVEDVKKSLENEVLKAYSWHELSAEQKANLERAITLVSVRTPTTLDGIDIVDFRSPNLLGQFKEGRSLISSKILSNFGETLRTLVHEVAHQHGGDGDKGHVDEIEETWTAIVVHLSQ